MIPENYAVLHIDKNPLNHRNIYGIDWKEVVKYIQGLGLKVIQISKNGEDLYGEWYKTRDMREVMSLVYNASLFVGLDSGPSHIAGCFEIPSAIFLGQSIRNTDTWIIRIKYFCSNLVNMQDVIMKWLAAGEKIAD